MRPLLRESVHPRGEPTSETLVAARGPYCGICERPLISTGRVWSADSEETYSVVSGEPPPLESSLLLCVNCELGQAIGSRVDPDDVILPVRETSFTLDDTSPFVYERAELNLNLIDEEGLGRVEPATLVVVRATSEQARLTAQLFGIDSGADDQETVTLPRDEWLSWQDPRPRLRTQAWAGAHAMGHRLTEEPISLLDLLGARKLVSVVGFVSVWATVLRDYVDVETVAQIVGADPITAPDELRAMVASTPDSFPGTDWNGFFGNTRPERPIRPAPA